MTNQIADRTWSDLPISPGEVLSEEIEALGMTQKDLALSLGRPLQVVNEIVRGKKAITEETALELERVLGVGAHVWLGLESTYKLTLARNREREQIQGAVDWLTGFPIKEMAKRNWIPKLRNKEEQVRAVLSFFGVASVDAYHKKVHAAAFRFSEKAKTSPGALAAWLRRGELEARTVETGRFDAELLLEAAHKARSLTTSGPEAFAPQLERLFSEAGVAFTVVPEFPKTGANGVARWLNAKKDKALIQLNLRYSWADIFWFTLFHEVAHLLLHKRQNIIVDGADISGDPAIEQEANQWARDFLIAPDAWQDFLDGQDLSHTAVVEFAADAGISTSIVVGRLQKEKLVPYSALTELKTRFTWVERAAA